MVKSAICGVVCLVLLVGCALKGEYQPPERFKGSESYILDVVGDDPRGFALVSKLATYEAVKHSSATVDDVCFVIDTLLGALDQDAQYNSWFTMLFDKVDWFNNNFQGEIIILQQYFTATAPPPEIMSQYDRYLIRTHLEDVKQMLQLLKP